jgi:hypothetical protein
MNDTTTATKDLAGFQELRPSFTHAEITHRVSTPLPVMISTVQKRMSAFEEDDSASAGRG